MASRKVTAALVTAALTAGLTGGVWFTPDKPRNIPLCRSDDGSGAKVCLWDAATQGNGKGRSFVMVNGHRYRLPIGREACVRATFYASQIVDGKDRSRDTLRAWDKERSRCENSAGGF